jgi:predicted phosphodiesterase
VRYGLLSDVHGNLAALRAALSFLEREAVDGYLCAGDVVGYGPQPNDCVELLASSPVRCVAGNHDLIATGRLSDDGIGRLARRTLQFTRSELAPSARAWLEQLPERMSVPGAIVTHASLTGPRRYVLTDDLAAQELVLLARADPAAGALVIGHTHRATVFGERSGRVRAPARVHLGAGERWLVNPGAVGQSREQEVGARVAVLDLARQEVAFHRVEYDVEATRAELRRRGLPVAAVHVRPRSRPRTLAWRLVRLRRR